MQSLFCKGVNNVVFNFQVLNHQSLPHKLQSQNIIYPTCFYSLNGTWTVTHSGLFSL